MSIFLFIHTLNVEIESHKRVYRKRFYAASTWSLTPVFTIWKFEEQVLWETNIFEKSRLFMKYKTVTVSIKHFILKIFLYLLLSRGLLIHWNVTIFHFLILYKFLKALTVFNLVLMNGCCKKKSAVQIQFSVFRLHTNKQNLFSFYACILSFVLLKYLGEKQLHNIIIYHILNPVVISYHEFLANSRP